MPSTLGVVIQNLPTENIAHFHWFAERQAKQG